MSKSFEINKPSQIEDWTNPSSGIKHVPKSKPLGNPFKKISHDHNEDHGNPFSTETTHPEHHTETQPEQKPVEFAPAQEVEDHKSNKITFFGLK